MGANYQKLLDKDYQKLLDSKLKTKEKQLEIAMNNSEINAKNKYQPLLDEKDKKLEEKDKEIARLKALLNIDGTNAGIPTSQTPINKKKVISNTRTKSNKNIGGQPGHKKHKLEKFNDEEINDNVDFELENCPCCSGKLTKTGEICKDELSYRFIPIKRRNHFITYKCNC